MNAAIAVIALLAVAALAGLAEALRRTGWRRWIGAGAALTAPALLYFVLFPPLQQIPGRTLRVLTPGAAATTGDDARTVALPGSTATAGVERVPDLATALRRHPDTASIDVVGQGLGAADRDAARGHALRFDAPPLPRGIVALEWPGDLRAGHGFTLSGTLAQPDGLRIALREPGSARQEPVAPGADGRFAFALFAPRAAEVAYELTVVDAAGTEVERVAVPVEVRDGTRLRLQLLAGGPDPDLKYLQRWALDAGHTVDARIALSRGLAQQRGTATTEAGTLAETDVVVIDERAWTQLDKAARARLLAAVDQGLGLLLRLGGTPSAALVAEWRALGIDLANADVPATLRIAGETADGATAALQRVPLRATGDGVVALAQDRDGTAVAAVRNRGQGRLGVWWLYDTRTLTLSGQAPLHDALWSRALDRLARPRQTAPPSVPAQSWQFERIALCAEADTLSVVAPSGADHALLTRRGSDARWCGGYWPRESGWHTLRAGTSERRFYVRAADDAVALHQAADAAATRALAGNKPAPAAAHIAGPRWPWFVAWLMAATLLWWLQRSAVRTQS
ncbi:MAG TPA: hypothetical protein VLF18_22155 [Tahibacter sp.]|uniref:hypothetical protein n=1 Tax=Tahibacter sp. TaxID=2056211 RepID=UPI002B634E94|nr:hypothetical protein [Tahibacter sp.]HSX62897.1 hypothetical protein [Tahibacter sp.]